MSNERYSEKLEKEIASKLIEFFRLSQKQEVIENDTGLSEDALLGADTENDDYGGLEGSIEEWQSDKMKLTVVRNSLISAFTRAAHYPIFSLPEKKICELFHACASALRENGKTSSEAIDDLLNDIDLTERQDRVRRSQLIEPLFLACPDQLWLERMYREIVASFVGGSFSASCVLCRAVCEIALKKCLKKKVPSGGFENQYLSDLLKFCEKYKLELLNPDAINYGRNINFTVNELMHEGKEVNEEVAFKLFQSTQIFLRKIFQVKHKK